MTLSAFEAAAREHLANTPTSWTVHRVGPRNWQVRTHDGAVVDRCATKAAAEQSRRSGTYVRLWQERTDWYLGHNTNPRDRTLTTEERAIIERITHPANAAATIRAVRYHARDEHDHPDLARRPHTRRSLADRGTAVVDLRARRAGLPRR